MRALMPLLLVVAACSADASEPERGPGTTTEDPPACATGELMRDDGSCQAAGVPPGACGDGFVHTGDHGCEPTLPTERCPPGLMAVPGDAACRPIADCGTGKWGNIPVESNTQYIDPSFVGVSDGSAGAPWTDIQQGIDAAEPGAIVALAAGDYYGNYGSFGAAFRLWGRCPSMVTLRAANVNEYGALSLWRDGLRGTEVAQLTIEGDDGSDNALLLIGVNDVLVHHVWFKSALNGLHVQDYEGVRASATLQDSLVEDVANGAANAIGSDLVVERSMLVPGARPGATAVGVHGEPSIDDGTESSVTVRGSLIERFQHAGADTVGGVLIVDRTVIRDSVPEDASEGRGVQALPSDSAMADVQVRRSVLSRNTYGGITVDSSALQVEHTVIQDSLGTPGARPETLGDGIVLQTSTFTADGQVMQSLLEGNDQFGMVVFSSNALLDGVRIRDTLPDPMAGDQGVGLVLMPMEGTGVASSGTVRNVVLERNSMLAMMIQGSNADIDNTLFADTLPDVSERGRGLQIQADPVWSGPTAVVVRNSAVQRSTEMGVVITSGEVTLENFVVDQVAARSDGTFGDGIAVVSSGRDVGLGLLNGAISHCARAGLGNFGARVRLEGSNFECNAFHLNGESNGLEGYAFVDAGGNLCGCNGESTACKVQSTELTPPEALE